MSLQNTIKNAAYDNAAYLARGTFSTVMTAGSGGVSAKFVAHANLVLFGLNAYTTTAGTSTYTNTQYYQALINGGTTVTSVAAHSGTASAVIHVAATQLSLIRIYNTNTATGVAPALATATIGPFSIDQYYTNGTGTGGVGVYAQFALNTNTGSAGFNGLAVNQGDQVYVVNGTDASAVNLINIDYQVLPLSDLVA